MTNRMVAASRADLERIDSDEETAASGRLRTEAHPALAVQRTAGNAAVGRALERWLDRTARAGNTDAAVRRALSDRGRPLEARTRMSMEEELGHDFSRVRVHTDANAAASARALGAKAYTVGQDITFADDAFDSFEGDGRSLLAHELVHTVQQSASSPGRAEGQAIRVEPPGTGLERAAEQHDTGAAGPVDPPGLQRQPAPQGQAEPESVVTIFVADDAKKTDKRFARDQALKDAARIRKIGSLTTDDRQLVRAKLRFFEGAAWQVYSDTIRPALVEVTREEIEMEGDAPAPAAPDPATAQLGNITRQLKFLQEQPTYIDNHIKEVNYYTAELAVIHYYDDTKYELGLSPKWMKPPVVEVDYYTPAEQIRPYGEPSGRFGYMNEWEMAQAPGDMPYAELLKTYVHEVNFYVEKGTGRVVPSRINFLTAPTLCKVLRDSLIKWEEEYVKPGVMIGLGGTLAIAPYAGAGGLPVNTGVAATSMFAGTAARVALSPTGRKLAREMDALLASGASKTIEAEGVQFAGVEVTRQGSVLAVKRFMSKAANPGQGTGYRMAKEFEDAAAEVGRLNGAKTVAVDVGIIINPGWRVILEARGYVKIVTEGRWVKTIKLE